MTSGNWGLLLTGSSIGKSALYKLKKEMSICLDCTLQSQTYPATQAKDSLLPVNDTWITVQRFGLSVSGRMLLSLSE